jgi:hypothetical protein
LPDLIDSLRIEINASVKGKQSKEAHHTFDNKLPRHQADTLQETGCNVCAKERVRGETRVLNSPQGQDPQENLNPLVGNVLSFLSIWRVL